MKEIEFNLLTELWVRVRLPDNSVQEVSLTDALLHAQDYVDLAGEMPTQDAAMLRLLLAVLFTVFSSGAFPGAAAAGLSGTVERPLLAVPPDTSLLAGAGGGHWHRVQRSKTQWRNV